MLLLSSMETLRAFRYPLKNLAALCFRTMFPHPEFATCLRVCTYSYPTSGGCVRCLPIISLSNRSFCLPLFDRPLPGYVVSSGGSTGGSVSECTYPATARCDGWNTSTSSVQCGVGYARPDLVGCCACSPLVSLTSRVMRRWVQCVYNESNMAFLYFIGANAAVEISVQLRLSGEAGPHVNVWSRFRAALSVTTTTSWSSPSAWPARKGARARC